MQGEKTGKQSEIRKYIRGMEHDLDDTPLEEVKASLRKALQESKSAQRIPISQMWEGIDTDP